MIVEKISATGLIVTAILLLFLSSLGGALLALQLDEPEVVVTERVVEVTPVVTPAEPSDADLETLRALYSEVTGKDEEWMLGLVHEISGMVCNGEPSANAILDSGLERDISMSVDDLEQFVEQVREVCPE